MSAWFELHLPNGNLNVARGLVSGMSSVRIVGRATGVTTSKVTIWGVTTAYSYLAAAQTLVLNSSSASDTAAGTGARTVKIYGLDTNYRVQSETMTLNGVTGVNTANTYLRINQVEVITVGSSGWNVGNISLKYSTNTVGYITATDNISLAGLYTVPLGKTIYLYSIDSAGSTGKDVIVDLAYRPLNECFKLIDQFDVYQNHIDVKFDFPIPLLEKTDIELRGISSASDTSIGAFINAMIVDN